jgi:hypothetical protein
MQIAKLRRAASAAAALVAATETTSIVGWKNGYWKPVDDFATLLNSALHEGSVGQHPAFWQSIVNKTIGTVADDEFAVRTVMQQRTLYGQVAWFSQEIRCFSQQPVTRTHNRFALARAFCEALKTESHPNL